VSYKAVNAGILTVLVALFALPINTQMQTSRTRTVTATGPSLLASLPQSDAVAMVKLKRALDEAMPRLLASNPAKLSTANAQIEHFKSRTGIDPRLFEQVALGIRYSYPSERTTKLQTVGLARGTFSAPAMVAAGRIAASGKFREEKYQGKSVYIFTLDDDIKLFGLFNFRLREFAASPLDANTLAIGDSQSIRNVIDVSLGRKGANAELIALASRDPNAIMEFGGNISPALLKSLDIGNQAIAQDLESVRQVYGSFGITQTDVEMFLAARTLTADSARQLGDTLEGLKQLGAVFVPRLSGAKSTLAKSALQNLKIVTQANELHIRTAVAQSAIAPLVSGL
jgi:hypothetical protein